MEKEEELYISRITSLPFKTETAKIFKPSFKAKKINNNNTNNKGESILITSTESIENIKDYIIETVAPINQAETVSIFGNSSNKFNEQTKLYSLYLNNLTQEQVKKLMQQQKNQKFWVHLLGYIRINIITNSTVEENQIEEALRLYSEGSNHSFFKWSNWSHLKITGYYQKKENSSEDGEEDEIEEDEIEEEEEEEEEEEKVEEEEGEDEKEEEVEEEEEAEDEEEEEVKVEENVTTKKALDHSTRIKQLPFVQQHNYIPHELSRSNSLETLDDILNHRYDNLLKKDIPRNNQVNNTTNQTKPPPKASTTIPPPLLLWNVQGCSTPDSIKLLNTQITHTKPSLTLLTETNLTKENKSFKFNYPDSITECAGRGSGVAAISHNNSILLKPIKQHTGRFLLFTILHIKILLIYAPSSTTNRSAWIKDHLNSASLDPDIDLVLGDFNVNSLNKSDPLNTFLIQHMSSINLSEISFQTPTRQNSIIDRIFVSPKAIQLFHNLNIVYGSKSDHRMLIFELRNSFSIPKKSSLWAVPHYIVNDVNSITITDDLIDQGEAKLKTTIIKDISKSNNIEYINQKRYELQLLLKKEDKDKLFQSAVSHMTHSEVPSKYLTSKLKSREKQKIVQAAINPQTNQIVNTNAEILEAHRIYYEDLYSKANDDETVHRQLLKSWNPIVDDQVKRNMCKPISKREILIAIKYLANGKSPGEDGLTNTFYKTHCHSLLNLLVPLFNHFLFNSIDDIFKKGILITIYKGKGDPLHPESKRPITLLNTDYKIYSKIINNRLLWILPKVTSRFQNGFVPTRHIYDNIICMEQAITHLDEDGIITLYDMKKAFDSVSHESIIRTLKHIGIPEIL
eukprot:gene9085-11135_t